MDKLSKFGLLTNQPYISLTLYKDCDKTETRYDKEKTSYSH